VDSPFLTSHLNRPDLDPHQHPPQLVLQQPRIDYDHQTARAEFATGEDYPLETNYQDNSKEEIFNSMSNDDQDGQLTDQAYQIRHQDDMIINDNEYAAEEAKEVQGESPFALLRKATTQKKNGVQEEQLLGHSDLEYLTGVLKKNEEEEIKKVIKERDIRLSANDQSL
jgi:hypothetical protein